MVGHLANFLLSYLTSSAIGFHLPSVERMAVPNSTQDDHRLESCSIISNSIYYIPDPQQRSIRHTNVCGHIDLSDYG